MWLNDDIINCMLGKLVAHFDIQRRNNWPIDSAFFTYLVSSTESSSERLRMATVKPKGMVLHKMPTINYVSVSRQFDAINPFTGDNLVMIHIPVNFIGNMFASIVLLFDSKYSAPSQTNQDLSLSTFTAFWSVYSGKDFLLLKNLDLGL